MELLEIVSELVPGGKPNFELVVARPMIRDLLKTTDRRTVLKVLFLLVQNYCNSVNVKYNMTEDQQIEAAAMLIDECGNFRLEDYTMMFAMAKRGSYVKVYDRLDLTVISQILDAYWQERNQYADQKEQQEEQRLNSLGAPTKLVEGMHPFDAKLVKASENLIGYFSSWKAVFKEMNDGQK